MARPAASTKSRAKKRAAQTAAAKYQPQIKGERRNLHAELKALQSEEDPLNQGIENAEDQIRNAGLSPADQARALKALATRSADIPAGIASQELTAREGAHGNIAALEQAEGAERSAILNQILEAAATRRQETQAEVAAEQRQDANALALKQEEKNLGLGTYDQTPSPYEEAEIAALQAKTANGGLTPSEERTVHKEHVANANEHGTAAATAKQLFEEAKGGAEWASKLGIPADPKEWTDQQWTDFVAGTRKESHHQYGVDVSQAAAEKAVQAIRDHVEPQPSPGAGFGLVKNFANVARSALQQPGQSPAELLKRLPTAGAGY